MDLCGTWELNERGRTRDPLPLAGEEEEHKGNPKTSPFLPVLQEGFPWGGEGGHLAQGPPLSFKYTCVFTSPFPSFPGFSFGSSNS